METSNINNELKASDPHCPRLMEEEALSTIKYGPKQEKLGHKQEKLCHKHEKLGHKQEKLGHKHEKLGHHSLKMIQMNCSATKSSDKNSPLTKVRPRKVRTHDATPLYPPKGLS